MIPKQIYFHFVLISTICYLTACSSSTPQAMKDHNFASYYLLIKQLPVNQLRTEIAQQKHAIKHHEGLLKQQAQVKLLLLHALPSSPIHNSFQSKALLNVINKEQPLVVKELSATDQALLTLLADQLDQTIVMHNQLSKQLAKQSLQAKNKQQQMATEISTLKQLINQLTQIEQAIHDDLPQGKKQ